MTSTKAARAALRYVCSGCGAASPKWEGRCPGCGAWNSLAEEVDRVLPGQRRGRDVGAVHPTPLGEVAVDQAAHRSTSLTEVDRVLGGGIVAGALILLGGDPGIGKSTLALQVAAGFSGASGTTLYCAGEESASQLALRAARLGIGAGDLAVLAETDIERILAAIAQTRPPLAVIDSVQTLYDGAVPGSPGSPTQIREAINRIMLLAKETGVPILLIGHVTKEGAIAGPRTLEHMVDVVLYLEGERHGEYRLLRGIKNRFGPAGELGLFSMTVNGLQLLEAPGRAFIDQAKLDVPGNVLTVTCEGQRPLVVEVQALVTPTPFGLPRRTASGFDLGRLHLLIAVLEQRAKVRLSNSDVYVNVAGGVRLSEPAVDLAIAVAVAGASRNQSLGPGCICLGEVGLGGEIRRVTRLRQRLGEAANLGITEAIAPAGAGGDSPVRLRPVATLAEALHRLNGA